MKKEVKMQFQSLIKSLCVVLLYFIWPYLTNAIVGKLNVSNNIAIFLNFIADFILLFIIVMLYLPSLQDNLKGLGKKGQFQKGLKIFGIGFALYLISNFILCIVFPDLESNNLNNMLRAFEGNHFLLFLVMVFYYPVVEELVFKKTFRDVIESKWVFIILTGVVNATFEVLLSATVPLDIVNIVPVFIFYSTISYIYYETDNIFVSTFYRVVYNLLPGIGVLVSTGIIMNYMR